MTSPSRPPQFLQPTPHASATNFAVDPSRIEALRQIADDPTLLTTPEDLRRSAEANAELGRIYQNAGGNVAGTSTYADTAAYRFGRALARALALRENAAPIARALLDATPESARLIEMDGLFLPRNDLEEISRGYLPLTPDQRARMPDRRAALEQTWQNITREGFEVNIHMGGFLVRGAETLERIRNINQVEPPSLNATINDISTSLGDDPRAGEGLRYALSQNSPINDGALRTTTSEVIRQMWAYCKRQADPALRQNLLSAFASRLRDIGEEHPCNTGCVQRILQTVDGIDLRFSENAVPSASELADEIVSLIALADPLLDKKLEEAAEISARPPSLKRQRTGIDAPRLDTGTRKVEAAIEFKQATLRATIEQSLINQRRLPEQLVHDAMRAPLDAIESNELYLADLDLGKLSTDYRNHQGESALWRAFRTNNLSALAEQIGEGADANTTDTDGNLLLHLAVATGDADMVEALAQAPDIDVNRPSPDNSTALMMAAVEGHVRIVKSLLGKQGIDINRQNAVGQSALILATANNHTEVVEALLETRHANANLAEEEFGNTALMTAVEEGEVALVKLLLGAQGLDINSQNAFDYTALMLAAEAGNREIIELLLGVNGIDVNVTDNVGYSALAIAADHGHADAVQVLLEHGQADVNMIAGEEGETALMMAAQHGYTAVVEHLLQARGIDINKKSEPGYTALMLATIEGHHETVSRLLAHDGAAIHETGPDQKTLLILAAWDNRPSIVDTLLKTDGIRVNQADTWNNTALIYAAMAGASQVVTSLLAMPGIDVNHRNHRGQTALELATANAHRDIADMLKQAGAHQT